MQLLRFHTLLGLTVALALSACRYPDKHHEDEIDSLGYYTPAEYSQSNVQIDSIRISRQRDPDRRAVADAVQSGAAVSIRTLINIIIRDQASLAYDGRGGNIEDGIHQRLDNLVRQMAVNDASAIDIGQLKDLMDDTIHQMTGKPARTSPRAISIFHVLNSHVGTAYTNTLLFDIVLRMRLGTGYNPDRMVVIFEQGNMLLGEAANNPDGSVTLIGYETNGRYTTRRVFGPASQITQQVRVVRTNDFIFSEAMKMNMVNAGDFAERTVGRYGAKIHLHLPDPTQNQNFAATPNMGVPLFGIGDLKTTESPDLQPQSQQQQQTLPPALTPNSNQPPNAWNQNGPRSPMGPPAPQNLPMNPQGPRGGGSVSPESAIQDEAAKRHIGSLVCAVEVDGQQAPAGVNQKLQSQFQFLQIAGTSDFAPAMDSQPQLASTCRQMAMSFLMGNGRARSILERLGARGETSMNIVLATGGRATKESVSKEMGGKASYRIYIQGAEF